MTQTPAAPAADLGSILRKGRGTLWAIGLFSAMINLLGLTGSLYMLQVYDRVLASHSVPTLVGLSLLALVLFIGYGLLDMVRARVLSGLGLRLDRALRQRVFGLVVELPLRTKDGASALLPMRDLDTIRNFLAGNGPIALIDMPWMPIYLGLIYVMHPWLGLLATAGGLCLVALAALTEIKGRAPMQAASVAGAARQSFAEAGRRNAEVVRALGMRQHLAAGWSRHTDDLLGGQKRAADATAVYGTVSKVARLVLQSAVLGLGAYLVIIGQASGGVMIAASILTSRALAPIEIAIGNWRAFIAVRQSWARLGRMLAVLPQQQARTQLPAPKLGLAVDDLAVAAPGQQKLLTHGIGFKLDAGDGLGIIGPSASGKSTLVRALVGAWTPARGTIRLDGATLDQWPADDLGRHMGYLPQDIELFDGTVAENIARFDPAATDAAILAAAAEAGVHDMIVALPAGYDTRIGESGAMLSAGQRQRIALARALYGAPFLVVLDEPNSNLDAEGDAALTRAIQAVRARGGIVVVVAHRPSALQALDKVLVLAGGQLQAFGPKAEIIGLAGSQPSQPSGRLKVVADTAQGGAAK